VHVSMLLLAPACCTPGPQQCYFPDIPTMTTKQNTHYSVTRQLQVLLPTGWPVQRQDDKYVYIPHDMA
jgi:hypothetical protein